MDSGFVSAVPGSGKTETLIAKCYDLMIAEGVEHVAAITFTERAAKEMLDRLKEKAARDGKGDIIRQLPESNVGTIHNFCSRILRSYGSVIGLPWHFRVIDELEAHNLLERTVRQHLISLRNGSGKSDEIAALDRLIDDFGMDVEQIMNESVEIIEAGKGYFSYMMNSGDSFFTKFSRELVDSEVLKECIQRTKVSAIPLLLTIVGGVVARYQQVKLGGRLMDFDDLLVYTLSVLEEKGEEISSKVRYILVDEFQDTDELQILIFEKFLELGSTFFIVGDLNQSIYSFRGAHPAAQRRMVEKIKNRVILPTNRRSGKRLVSFYNTFFPRIMNYQKMEPSTDREGDAFLYLVEDKLRAIAEIIKKKVREGTKLADIAILSRTSSDFFNLKRYLRREGIDCVIISGESILKSQEGLDILSLVRYLGDPSDEVAQVSLLFSPFFDMGVTDLASKRREFNALLESKFGKYREMLKTERIDFILNRMLWREGYISRLLGSDDGREKVSRVNRIMELITSYVTSYGGDPHQLSQWIKNAQETKESGPVEDLLLDDSRVKIMTIHQAKGLEFNVVLVYDLRTGLDRDRYYVDEYSGVIPKKDREFINSPGRGIFSRSEKFRFSADEEVRILYVAFTRARDELHLILSERELKDEKAVNKGTDLMSVLQKGLGVYKGMSNEEREKTVKQIGLTLSKIGQTEPLKSLPFSQDKPKIIKTEDFALDSEDDEKNEVAIMKFVSENNDRIVSLRVAERGSRVTTTEKGLRIFEDVPSQSAYFVSKGKIRFIM
ncbi:MAG: UvrD-helicase domain-containing protein [Thermoplasmata archaeon]